MNSQNVSLPKGWSVKTALCFIFDDCAGLLIILMVSVGTNGEKILPKHQWHGVV